jgi:hypothetical protein
MGGCDTDSGGTSAAGGSGGSGFVPPEYGSWVMFEPEGASCSDGSPYRFWVEFPKLFVSDEEPLQSYFEEDGESPYVPCTPVAFDADACEAAVNP